MAEPVDKSALSTLRGLQRPGRPDFLTEMIDIFIVDVDKTFAELHRALEARDADAFGRAGHGLKSSCGILGAHLMVAIAQDIQAMGKLGDLATAGDALARLEAEYERVRPVLQAERR